MQDMRGIEAAMTGFLMVDFLKYTVGVGQQMSISAVSGNVGRSNQGSFTRSTQCFNSCAPTPLVEAHLEAGTDSILIGFGRTAAPRTASDIWMTLIDILDRSYQDVCSGKWTCHALTERSTRSLEESVVIVQPVTSAQSNFRPHIDTRLRQLDSFSIRLALIDSAASYRHIVTKWSEVIRLVKLTEGAVTWPALALATFPHPPRRCATSRVQ